MMTMRDCEVVRLVLADEMDWIGGVCRRMYMCVYVCRRKEGFSFSTCEIEVMVVVVVVVVVVVSTTEMARVRGERGFSLRFRYMYECMTLH